MRSSVLGILLLSSALSFANVAFADVRVLSDDDGDDRHGGHCRGERCGDPERTRCAHFNLYCSYENGCTASATFDKQVTEDGGEVADSSNNEKGNTNPHLIVSCPGNPTANFDNAANRFTSPLQTRIQAMTGPFPAITLNRGALHVPEYRTGIHNSNSTLELGYGNTSPGSCYIWNGPALK